MAYSAGQLSEAFNLVVATHISMCDECRATMSSFDALGGALLEDETLNGEAAPDLQATMALIKSNTPMERTPPPSRPTETPFPLVAYVGDNLDDVKWKSVGDGGQAGNFKNICRGHCATAVYSGWRCCTLIMVTRGPNLHWFCVGRIPIKWIIFKRGDVEIAGEDLHHTPVADVHSDCICLAVTDSPLKFSGVLRALVAAPVEDLIPIQPRLGRRD